MKDNRVFGAVGFALITGAAYGVTWYFSPRAAFLQVGAIMGTIMAANVFFRIIPAQRHMLAATTGGGRSTRPTARARRGARRTTTT